MDPSEGLGVPQPASAAAAVAPAPTPSIRLREKVRMSSPIRHVLLVVTHSEDVTNGEVPRRIT
ncbi:hypothetical protein GCM10010121_079990 [Streptomyces brasiliensis]|uniref:Uncharacterized protein n=1 Tax=Streptomyces brasiliensis TaxID=1954 RepID=A0A917P304_9ACTN|nr:hypothetical protein GCM10010121_079990 [Streptomyces brasiliensis]